MNPRVEQCVILAGGAGSRLGALTENTPKPMLAVAGRPFLEHLVEKAVRHGLPRILILAGSHAHVIETWLASGAVAERHGAKIDVSTEHHPLGTGGALALAKPLLEHAFVLLNGDTWFDCDWRRLADFDRFGWSMALHRLAKPDRYETVRLADDRVIAFEARAGRLSAGLINAGVYRVARDLVPDRIAPLSLETELLPRLVEDGAVGGLELAGDFIDIGVPASFSAAQDLLRPAQ